jgi:general stress protein 26
MRVRTQTRPETARLAEALEDHGVAMMTLNEPSGLASRPMTPLEVDRDGAIWFMTSAQALAAIVGDGTAVNLAFADESRGRYVSITGWAELVDDAMRKDELWTVAGRPWFDGPHDPDLVLLRIRPLQAELWDGPHGRLTRLLAMAASAIAGREVGLGDKETLDIAAGPDGPGTTRPKA